MCKRREVDSAQEPIVKTEKSLNRMNDAEFVYNLDRMSRPDLITRLSDVCNDPVSIESFLSRSDIRVVDSHIPFTIELPKSTQEEAQTDVLSKETDKTARKEKKALKVCDKKRTMLLVLVAIVALIALVAIVLGVVGIGYVYPIQTEEKSYGIVDPVVAAIDTLFKTEGNAYLDGAFAGASDWKELFVAYATAAATVLYVVCFVAMFIKALFAAFERGTDGSYKKRDFLFPSIVALLCSIVTVLGTSALVGASILSFVTMESAPKIGYALYGLVALPVLTLLFGAFAYGRKK